MSNPAYPNTIHAFWGTDPHRDDKPTAHSFATPAAYQAFAQGVDASEGWMEAQFVASSGYYVNKDGEVALRAGRIPEARSTDRFVLWGDPPEVGARPLKFSFATDEEAAAFQEGVEAMAGWTRVNYVPGSDYKPFNGLDEAQDHFPHARQAIEDARTLDEAPLTADMVFVNPQGAFVEREWDPSQPVANEPVSPEQWRQRFDAELVSTFSLTIEDAGLDDDDVQTWSQSPYGRHPELAARAYGEKYDLSPARRRARPKM